MKPKDLPCWGGYGDGVGLIPRALAAMPPGSAGLRETRFISRRANGSSVVKFDWRNRGGVGPDGPDGGPGHPGMPHCCRGKKPENPLLLVSQRKTGPDRWMVWTTNCWPKCKRLWGCVSIRVRR